MRLEKKIEITRYLIEEIYEELKKFILLREIEREVNYKEAVDMAEYIRNAEENGFHFETTWEHINDYHENMRSLEYEVEFK